MTAATGPERPEVLRGHGHLRDPGTKVWTEHPLWFKDPKTTVFRETLQYARQVGHAGPPGRKATEVLAKYIIVDMFAKSIQGMTPEDAVKWAAAELRKVYSA